MKPAGTRAVYNLEDLRRWPEATAGLAHPLRLGVFGDPVAHSASPPMHDAALALLDLPTRYARIHVRAEELPKALGLLAPMGFTGVNLTIPHKAAALALLDAVDPRAARLGVVNTVRVEADGSLLGFNTDGPGFARAVREEFGCLLRGKQVMILGAAGGAGRALAAQCVLEGCARVVLVNRTPEKTRALERELRLGFQAEVASETGSAGTRLEVVEWERAPTMLSSSDAEIDLVVNTTSIGLKTGDESPVAETYLRPGLLVFDTVYRSGGAPTPLVAAARRAGARTAGGLSLLLHQGVLAFEHWFNQPAPVEVMRRALEG